MKKIAAYSLCLFAGLGLGLTACADEGLYTCSLIWQLPGGDEVEVTLDYSGLADAEEAVSNCQEEQETHEDRPEDAESWDCDCESDD